MGVSREPRSNREAFDDESPETVEVAIFSQKPGDAVLSAERHDLSIEGDVANGVCLADRFHQKRRNTAAQRVVPDTVAQNLRRSRRRLGLRHSQLARAVCLACAIVRS